MTRVIRALASSDEFVRTALRVFVNTLCKGMGELPAKIRRSSAARTARGALYAASEFLNDYDEARLEAEIEKLRQGLAPLANRGYDPIALFVLVVMPKRWRRRRRRRLPPPLIEKITPNAAALPAGDEAAVPNAAPLPTDDWPELSSTVIPFPVIPREPHERPEE
jgi:hypothetical protein